MFDCGQVTLADTDPVSKICLRNIEPPEAPDPSTDRNPVDRGSFCLRVSPWHVSCIQL